MKKAFTLIELIIVVAIIVLLALMVIPACHRIQEAQQAEPQYIKELRPLYQAWCKAHSSDLSFDEWKRLYDHNLLPR